MFRKIATVNTDVFRDALRSAKLFTKKGTLPVTEYVLISGDEKSLVIRACNLEQYISLTVPVLEISQDWGCVAVPAATLHEFLGQTGSKTVNLEVKPGAALFVLAGDGNATIKGIDPDEYPPAPVLKDAVTLDFPGDVLDQIKRRVGFACSDDPNRAVLHGVCFHGKNGMFHAMAADGFRAAIWRIGEHGQTTLDAIVPVDVIDKAARVFAGAEKITISFAPGLATFATQGVMLTTVLLNGAYPDLFQIMPKSEPKDTAIKGVIGSLQVALRQARIFANPEIPIARINASAEGLKVMASGPNGETTADVAIQVEGPGVEAGYNVGYLLDVMDAASGNGGMLTMRCKGAHYPVAFTHDDLPGWQSALMPMILS